MTDRPILFSGPMVRALLDGRKTQTRRVHFTQDPEFRRTCDEGCDSRLAGMCLLPKAACGRRRVTDARIAVGDRLWVREAWRSSSAHNDLAPRDIPLGDRVEYAADPERIVTGKPRPSMFMPRWASRLTLLVSEVRVERLQNISEADARAEGFPISAAGTPYTSPPPKADSWQGYATASFFLTWNALNSARGYGVEANPWVVAVTFDVVEANIDTLNARAAAA